MWDADQNFKEMESFSVIIYPSHYVLRKAIVIFVVRVRGVQSAQATVGHGRVAGRRALAERTASVQEPRASVGYR